LRLDRGSAGAPLWREFLANFTSAVGAVVFEDGFDPGDPIGAPHTLLAAAPDNDVVLGQLASAVLNLESVGASPSSTLGELQFTQRGGQRIPIHGGSSVEGAFNVVGYAPSDGTRLPGLPAGPQISALGLTTEGYPINRGSSFVLVTSFTDQGPEARALLSYSQSADPDSPHYADQTQRFADKAWRDVVFRERDIAADPELREELVSGPRR
jgi:acyl-homoserine-lactone acylase